MDSAGIQHLFYSGQGGRSAISSATETGPKSASLPGVSATGFNHFLDSQRALLLTDAAPESTDKAPRQMDFINSLWRTNRLPAPDVPDYAIQFVESLQETATAAAKKLGTQPAAVISVAALETGWGRHIIQTPSGLSSHNLFGIKAHNSSSPNSVMALTTEFDGETPKKYLEPFRSYASRSDSVADFANFILENPRYRSALDQAADSTTFIEQIHQAGYATDPDYADKVKSILLDVEAILDTGNAAFAEQLIPLPDYR
ncbi:MAG: glucosaminidase domain-containing protein [Granulosicoccus sp.]|nr:glucosaminidase domain-containing protein [Granulosicoccus sp.]